MKLKINKAGYFLFILVVVISFISPIESSGIFLSKGKNIITFNNSEGFYVETLVKLNPEIKFISFYDRKESVGYVNLFEGIGKNFVIQKGVNYEIFMGNNATIIMPN